MYKRQSLANDASLKSWYGFSTTLGVNTGVIAFRSALARSIVASTRDSELLACLHCTYRVFALRLFLAEIGLQQVAPTPMGSDAMAVIQGVSVKTVHRDSRWSAIRFAGIKQAMEDLLISCYHLPGTDNGSDIYTKILPPALHFKHAMHQLGWPASAARDIAMLEQIHHDSVLMVGFPSAPPLSAWSPNKVYASQGNCGFGSCRAFGSEIQNCPATEARPLSSSDGLNSGLRENPNCHFQTENIQIF